MVRLSMSPESTGYAVFNPIQAKSYSASAAGGGMTIVEGGGEVLFGASTSSVAGGADVISSFKVGTDQLGLFGYDLSTVTQTATGAGLILTLIDSTRITLLGVTQLGANLMG